MSGDNFSHLADPLVVQRMNSLLQIKDLDVEFRRSAVPLKALRGVNLTAQAGRTLCVVGESGCGKSLTLQALLGLLPRGAKITGGTIGFDGKVLNTLPRKQLQDLRGKDIGLVFQDALTAFNPTVTIGHQLTEVLLRHGLCNRAEAREKAIHLLATIGVTAPAERLAQYPHELSGGLRQRAMIAMALIAEPKLLLADEPTTALDVTVQAQALKLLKKMQRELGIAIVFVTHDLGVVAAMADDVAVMYAGQVIETGPVESIFASPSHPYTRALFQCVPSLDPAHGAARLGTIPGRVPALDQLGAPGCSFRERCVDATAACVQPAIPMIGIDAQRATRCIRAHELNGGLQ
ncbi:ABC transporter ATP-binding protein [Paraburkholderia sp.]|uniref:ABC transporter ATP-binding protein n=1 Tax=Paraburkholderia sp. TaxID=1926495 RepID=UPI0039E68A9C